MVRDKLRSNEYFDEFIEQRLKGIEKSKERISNGIVSKERIPTVFKRFGASKLRILVAKYSGGYSLSEIKADYIILLKDFAGYWPEGQVLMNHNGKKLKQYLDYDDMLWMLSLGILLDVSKEDFQILVDLINRDGVKDKVYEYLIAYKLGFNDFDGEESYEFGWDLYCSLRGALNEDLSKEQRIELLENSLKSEWKKEHKQLLPSPKDRHETYFGAWSFESAAIVAILDLDDSSFRDNPYYPKDLVDYYRANK
ncbi:MAG: DUF1910 domain-containing protein [Saprospiraceae bacterium]